MDAAWVATSTGDQAQNEKSEHECKRGGTLEETEQCSPGADDSERESREGVGERYRGREEGQKRGQRGGAGKIYSCGARQRSSRPPRATPLRVRRRARFLGIARATSALVRFHSRVQPAAGHVPTLQYPRLGLDVALNANRFAVYPKHLEAWVLLPSTWRSRCNADDLSGDRTCAAMTLPWMYWMTFHKTLRLYGRP